LSRISETSNISIVFLAQIITGMQPQLTTRHRLPAPFHAKYGTALTAPSVHHLSASYPPPSSARYCQCRHASRGGGGGRGGHHLEQQRRGSTAFHQLQTSDIKFYGQRYADLWKSWRMPKSKPWLSKHASRLQDRYNVFLG
jgi:hypothetical protein